MAFNLSVIICTHNPRHDYLARVLEALKAQTLSTDNWELLVVDNASEGSVAASYNISWHPNARHVREENLGLTLARVRGITESGTDLLLFVDDDNVLASNYLMECTRIAKEWPNLGTWGGQQLAEFEGGEPREIWKREFWTSELKRDIWSNNYDRAATPVGAGICIRRHVAVNYAKSVTTNVLRRRLDRSGTGLNCAGDIDMAFTACDLGLGVGRFVSLALVHLIPAARLIEDYLLRLIEGFAYSESVLFALRGKRPERQGRIDRLVTLYKLLRTSKIERSFARALAKGRARALKDLAAVDQLASE